MRTHHLAIAVIALGGIAIFSNEPQSAKSDDLPLSPSLGFRLVPRDPQADPNSIPNVGATTPGPKTLPLVNADRVQIGTVTVVDKHTIILRGKENQILGTVVFNDDGSRKLLDPNGKEMFDTKNPPEGYTPGR